MLVMYLGWKLGKKTRTVKLADMDLETDTHTADEAKPEERTTRLARAKYAVTWLF